MANITIKVPAVKVTKPDGTSETYTGDVATEILLQIQNGICTHNITFRNEDGKLISLFEGCLCEIEEVDGTTEEYEEIECDPMYCPTVPEEPIQES